MAYLDPNTVTKEKLNELVESWSTTTFGLDFKFRPKQKESIIDIIWNWFHQTDNVILDAPTGSGKSIIAMIVAGVLSSYFGKKGYILISDLSLLQQYANDLEVYLPDWGIIRGQQTYNCAVNGFNFSVGACKLQGYTSYAEITAHCPECAPFCEYMLAREKAINANVTVCTYTHWLLQQNYVRPKMGEIAPFGIRDFVICDEGHKLLDIVQNHFSPKFGKEDETKIGTVIDHMYIKNKEQLKQNIKLKREEIKRENDNAKLKDLLNEYYAFINSVAGSVDEIKKSYGGKDRKLTKTERTVIYSCEFVKDHHCKFEDYVSIINRIGSDYIIKNDSEQNGNVIFNCLNESYLMKRTFHANAKKKMYMSATIGDPKAYASEISIDDYHYIKLPVVFDYTNSPIYYVNDYKMSYTEKDTSFPRITEMIVGIFKLYPNYRGIIQTGSYTFSKKLYEMLPYEYKKRILLYDDSRDKQEKLDEFKYSSNKVLVGPSLVEGLSLNDDLCRFQIIMKVPYPSLADKYVAAKSKFNPIWYSNATSIALLQGVGRGVRNEKDWCVTFILDACFNGLFSKCRSMFSDEFTNRIQVIPGTSLML